MRRSWHIGWLAIFFLNVDPLRGGRRNLRAAGFARVVAWEDREEGGWSCAEGGRGNRGGDVVGRSRARVVGQGGTGGTGGFEQPGFFQDFQRRSGNEYFSHNSLDTTRRVEATFPQSGKVREEVIPTIAFSRLFQTKGEQRKLMAYIIFLCSIVGITSSRTFPDWGKVASTRRARFIIYAPSILYHSTIIRKELCLELLSFVSAQVAE